jgi:hypothetical protein
MKLLKQLLFGARVEGCPLPPPTFKTTVPKDRPALDKWAKEMKFGSRYGHRGSFYHKN